MFAPKRVGCAFRGHNAPGARGIFVVSIPDLRASGDRAAAEVEPFPERRATYWEMQAPRLVGPALITFLVSTAASGAPATYYVAPAPTGDDAKNGTMDAPFASIAHAQMAAAPGDTVYLRGGVYSFTAGTNKCASQTDTVNAIVLNKSGASGNLIHYLAYPGEVPVFDFSKMKDDCRVKGFDVTGSWIHLKGLEVKGVPQNNMLNHESWGVWITGSNNIFEQLDLHHNMGPGLFIQNGGNNLVLNCDSHHNYDPMTSNGAGQSADGFGAHISAGAANAGNVFRGCRAWWNTDDGFDLINAFEPVVIENSWAWYHGYLPDTMTSVPDGNGNGFKAGGYGTDTSKFPSTVPKHVVRQCLSVQNKASGFYANHHPGPVSFNNNTGYNNKPSFNLLGMDAAGNDIHVGVLRNNVAFGGSLVSNDSGTDETTNSWTLSGVSVSAADFQSTTLTGLDGPRQADGSLPVLPLMRLAAGSDLIDKGVDVGLPYAGAAPDLGAFETGTPVGSGSGGGPGTGGRGQGGGAAAGGRAASGGITGLGGMATGSGGAVTSSGGASGMGTGGLPAGSSGGSSSGSGGSAAQATGGATSPGSGGAPSSGSGGGTSKGGAAGERIDDPKGCFCDSAGGGLVDGVASSLLALILAGATAVSNRRRRR